MESNASIINDILNGDRDKYSILVRRYETYVTLRVAKTVNNKDIAMQIVQQSFLKAFMQLRSLKNPDKFGSWVAQIAQYVTVDHFRKEAAYNLQGRTTSLQNLKSEPAGKGLSPASILIRNEKQEILAHAIDKLPEIYKEVINLHCLDGLSVEEVAQILECPESTIRSRLYRARNILSKKLKRYDLS